MFSYNTKHPYSSGFGYALIAGAWVRLLGKKRRGRKTLSIAEKKAKHDSDWIEIAKVAHLYLKDKKRTVLALSNAQKAIENGSSSSNPSSWEELASFWKNEMGDTEMAEKVLERAEEFAKEFFIVSLIKIWMKGSIAPRRTVPPLPVS